MLRCSRNSLQRKLLIAAVSSAAAALIAVALALFAYDQRTYHARMLDALTTRAALLAANLHAPLNFVDRQAANEALQPLAEFDDLVQACVYTKAGAIFAEFHHPELSASCPPPPQREFTQFFAKRAAVYSQIAYAQETAGWLYLELRLPSLIARLPQHGLTIGVVLLALICASAVYLLAVRRLITEPLLALGAAAQEVTERKDYTIRAPRLGADELVALTTAFNSMLDTIQANLAALEHANQELTHDRMLLAQKVDELKALFQQKEQVEAQLRHAQKLETLGTLAGGVAHDFNNILTPIVGYLDLVMTDPALTPHFSAPLEKIKLGCNKATDLVRQILVFSGRLEQNTQVVNLKAVLEETLKLAKGALPAGTELLCRICTEETFVRAVPSEIHQVLMNLITNAIYALRDTGGVLEISLSITQLDAPLLGQAPELPFGKYIRIDVRDTGCGISLENQERVFEPFFTTKKHGEGSGLGLSVVYGIVRRHHGAILLQSEPGQGSVFSVLLPHLDATTLADVAPSPAPTPSRGHHIMVVDDEEAVGEVVSLMLGRLGYRVSVFTDTGAAEAAFKAQGAQFDLVILDNMMPQASGSEIARRMRAHCATIPILLMSGLHDVPDSSAAAFPRVWKPLSLAELAAAVNNALTVS